jgi:hypothetical protein
MTVSYTVYTVDPHKNWNSAQLTFGARKLSEPTKLGYILPQAMVVMVEVIEWCGLCAPGFVRLGGHPN